MTYTVSSGTLNPTIPYHTFSGTPVSTEWFSDIPTNFGLLPVRCSQWHKKIGYLDMTKTESVIYILLYNCVHAGVDESNPACVYESPLLNHVFS